MNLLTEHDVAQVGGGLAVARTAGTHIAFPDPLPGMPYPGPVPQFA